MSMKQRYALTNPISSILGKSREDFTRDDLIKVIEERNIEKITLRYVALDGKLKELKIPFRQPLPGGADTRRR